jgi:hypothetical protein
MTFNRTVKLKAPEQRKLPCLNTQPLIPGQKRLKSLERREVLWSQFVYAEAGFLVRVHPDPCPAVRIKVKVHPCLDLNLAGSQQKNRPQVT